MRLQHALPLLLATLLLASCQSSMQKHGGQSAESCAPYDSSMIAGMDAEARVAWLTQRLDQCEGDEAARAADYYNRGTALLELNRFQEALADADAAIALAPQESRLFAMRCLAQMGLQQHAAATADCQQAVALSPGNAVLLALHGKALARNGEQKAALETLRQAAKDPDALKVIQQELKDTGYYSGAVDGIYGKGTEAGLKAWVAAGGP
jgi:tetratricopeptide (TPR) repeat protein